MTATTVLPEREAAEVQRRYEAFCLELEPSGEVGLALAMRAAVLATRMERCVEYETAVLTERVRQAEADFEAPEGVAESMAARLREQAGKRALFDASPEASLARKYEAAAERGFLRCLKELRTHERAVAEVNTEEILAKLGSFSPGEMTDQEFDKICFEEEVSSTRKPSSPAVSEVRAKSDARSVVPFAIGKPS